MDSSAESGASFGTSKLLSFPPNSGPIRGLTERKSCCPKTAAHSTSAFADIKRIIDEPEWEAFHKDLSSSDFKKIRVATQEPEAFSDEEIDFLAYGSATKNGGKRKQSENSLRDHPDSPSRRHKSKQVKTETEQSMETCEREKDRDSEILALTPIELNVYNCSVKIEGVAVNSNSYAVGAANSDVRKRIKQEPEWSSILESPVPTLDSENQCRITLNGNCDRGMTESLQDSEINNRVSSIVSEKLSLKQEFEPLEEYPDPDDRAFVSSSQESKCSPEESMENGTAPSYIVQQQQRKSPVKGFVQTTEFSHGKSVENAVTEDSNPLSSAKEFQLEADDPVNGYSISLSAFEQLDLRITDMSSTPDPELADLLVQKSPTKCFVQITDFRNGQSVGNSVAKDSDPTATTKELKLEGKDPVTNYPVSSSDTSFVGLDSTQDGLLSNNANDAVLLLYDKAEPIREKLITKYPIQLSNNENEHKNFDLFPKDTVPSTDCIHNGTMVAIPTPIAENVVVAEKPLMEILSFQSDKCQVVRRRSRSKGEKGSYKENSDDDESSPKVSSEDGDSSDEDFESYEPLSGDEVEIRKSKPLTKSCKELMNDEQLLEEIVDTVKSSPLFKPFCESELESLAPEVLKLCKTKGFMNCGVKSIISKYIQQKPKYLEMLKTYVYDGIDEDAIRLLPGGFNYGSKRIRLRVKCPVCSKTLTRRLFENHMNTHVNCRSHKCEKCGRKYLTEVALIKHEKESRCSGTQFECNVCSKVYKCKRGLGLHEKLHDPKKTHKCHMCDAVFPLPYSLKEHVVSHTNAQDLNQLANLFQCAVCSKQFATKKRVIRHHTAIHLEKECKKCNAKFQSSYHYKNHLRMHKKGAEKPLKCPHCDKCFAIHHKLKIHIRTHTGEKPHKCDICGRAFKQKSALNMHGFTHQGRKPYRCDKCGKDSHRKQDIIEHECPMDKSSEVTKEGDKDPVPAPVFNKAQNSSSTNKKAAFLSRSNLSNETDKYTDIRRSLRSKPVKVSYKERFDDD